MEKTVAYYLTFIPRGLDSNTDLATRNARSGFQQGIQLGLRGGNAEMAYFKIGIRGMALNGEKGHYFEVPHGAGPNLAVQVGQPITLCAILDFELKALAMYDVAHPGQPLIFFHGMTLVESELRSWLTPSRQEIKTFIDDNGRCRPYMHQDFECSSVLIMIAQVELCGWMDDTRRQDIARRLGTWDHESLEQAKEDARISIRAAIGKEELKRLTFTITPWLEEGIKGELCYGRDHSHTFTARADGQATDILRHILGIFPTAVTPGHFSKHCLNAQDGPEPSIPLTPDLTWSVLAAGSNSYDLTVLVRA